MCHDISFSATTIELITDYLPNIVIDGQIDLDFPSSVHFLAQAHRKQPVVIFEDGQHKLKLFEWGLIADYMNTPEKIKQYRSSMVNARSEKVLEKQSAWYRLRKKRCLIPVTGIFEHRKINGWKNKVPYHVKIANRSLFFLPGFYNYSPLPDIETGEVKGTFTFITRPANGLMKMIHNDGPNLHRMPLFMQPEMALQWLDEKLTDEDIKKLLDFELPSEELEAWPVFSIRTTKNRSDGKLKNEPFEWEGLPELGNDNPLPDKQKSLF
jgi:putative SOS response-associated peptidase YedK